MLNEELDHGLLSNLVFSGSDTLFLTMTEEEYGSHREPYGGQVQPTQMLLSCDFA